MTYLFDDNQADNVEAFDSTSSYLDELLNIDNAYFEGMVNQIYPPELQLNKANTSDTQAPFLNIHLSTLAQYENTTVELMAICHEMHMTATNI